MTEAETCTDCGRPAWAYASPQAGYCVSISGYFPKDAEDDCRVATIRRLRLELEAANKRATAASAYHSQLVAVAAAAQAMYPHARTGLLNDELSRLALLAAPNQGDD